MKKKEEHIIVDFLKDAVNQILACNTRRTGRMVLTRKAFLKMQEYQLDTRQLRMHFETGMEKRRAK